MGLNLFDSMGTAVSTKEVIKRLTEWYDCEGASVENGVYFETVDLVRTILTKDLSPKEVLDLYTSQEIVRAMDPEDLGHIAWGILQNRGSQIAFCQAMQPRVMEQIVYRYLVTQLADKDADAGTLMSMKKTIDSAVAVAVTGRLQK